MRRVLILAVLMALPAAARAHGGCYGHFSPGVPPPWIGPGSQQHRGGGQVPATIPRELEPVPPPPPGEETPSRLVFPGRRGTRPPALGLDSWVYWWAYNRQDALVRRCGAPAVTAAGLLEVGEIHRRDESGRLAPTETEVDRTVVPALLSLLGREVHFDTRCAALVALAKIGSTRPRLAPDLARRFVALIADAPGKGDLFVEETAALSLGVLGWRDESVVKALCDRMLDRRRTRCRAFAALGLGLLELRPWDPGGEDAADALRSVLVSPEEKTADVPACALLAMGLSGDRTFLPELVEMLRTGRAYRERDLDDLRLSYAASALGRLAESVPETASRAVLDALGKALVGSGTDTRRSAAIALGSVAGRPELSAIARRRVACWLDATARDGEAQAARFAMISLGRLAAAAGEDAELRRATLAVLARHLATGEFDDRPYAALALGIAAAGGEDAAWARDALRRDLSSGGDARNRAASAYALGLLGDRRAAADLLPRLEDPDEAPVLRGAAAVALGLLGEPEAEAGVRSALLGESDLDLRSRMAVAAGLLGDRDVVEDLLSMLSEPGIGHYLRGSTTMALGRLGDRRALDPLLELALDESAQDIARALAVVAVGLIADENAVSRLARLARDVNYRAQVDAVREALTIL